MGETDEDATHLARTGWIQKSQGQARVQGRSDTTLVAAYGQSFSINVALELGKLDPALHPRVHGAPSAPLNHTFAAYLADRQQHEAKFIIIGILASSLYGLETMAHMTWHTVGPAAYMYPRFVIQGDELEMIPPPVSSLEELREALADSRRWREIGEVLRSHDVFFSSWIFFDSMLDRSVLGRAARHAWAQRQQAALLSHYHRPDGFAPELAAAAQATLEAFADSIRADGRIPVVLLFNNYGYEDHLYRVMKPVLDQKQILYVSSHEFVDASDRGSFLSDGHFLPELDQAMARRLLEIVSSAQDGPRDRFR